MQAFPWPAGKAPWLKENGGTGIVPDGALEKFGISSRCNSPLSWALVSFISNILPRCRLISVASAEEEFKVAAALPSAEEEIREPKNVKVLRSRIAV